MSDFGSIYDAVQEFLVQEHHKLSEDRKLLDFILSHLEEKQQNFSFIEDGSKKTNPKILYSSEDNTQRKSNENNTAVDIKQFDENHRTFPSKIELHFNDELNKLKHYNCQTEKDRLAYLFENSPYAFGRRCKPSKHKQNAVDNYDKSRENKENLLPNNDCSRQRKSHKKDETPRVMVRYGEFSPLNPAFRGSGKPFLGLGEYEERRKIFLEKKKREYHEYLDNAKHNKSKMNKRKGTTRPDNISSPERSESSTSQKSLSFHEIVLSPKDVSEVSTFTKWRQDTYRKELDNQIAEKKRIQQQQKDKEKKECENYELQDILQRRNLMRSIEEEFRRRINSCNIADQRVHDRSNTPVLRISPSPPRTTGQRNVFDESDPRITSRVRSPILKHTTETCAVDDFNTYKKLQRELYKIELSKQIEEKRNIVEQRKLRELEEEKKIDAKIQKEEEKLRLEYEKEQAEREYRASQKVQLEERLQENLRKMQRENEEKKNALKTRPIPKQISKPYPTNHSFSDKNSTKNVSFAPQAFVHTIYNENEYKRNTCSVFKDTETDGEYDPVIIDAPYLLAVKDVMNHSEPVNYHPDDPRLEESRSPSPVLPALQTRYLLKAIPKISGSAGSTGTGNCSIPPGVSMSAETRDQYIRDSKVLSNLPEIRRKLMQKQSNVRSE